MSWFCEALFRKSGLGHNLTLETFHFSSLVVYLPQVKQNLIFNSTNVAYELHDELPNELSIVSYEIFETLEKCQIYVETWC